MIFNKIPIPNEHYQTKQNALKTKNDKIFKKMTKKKKRFYAINDTNTFQMSNECMKSLIFNSIQKGENMKKHILSLTLGSLLVSTLSA
ncbi:hypothetical protein, partial [Helicobacter pylori]|uniref:hypothetical protein n=1 Tax=Helicobacter pylori TaxID=210 RepID=UPI001EE841DD